MGYDVEIGYLEYEDTTDRISIPLKIRERHLTQDTQDAVLQAIGTHLQIAIFSDRDNILIRIPLNEWKVTDGYQASLSGRNGGLISVGRFECSIANFGDKVPAGVRTHGIEGP